MRVRRMAAEDASAVAGLSGQLGYPTTAGAVRRRWGEIGERSDHAVLVAEGADGRVVGWVHAHERRLLLADRTAEVLGLVVDEGERGAGIGRLLLAEAERWAAAAGCAEMRVPSNVVRREAHAFYEKRGYAIAKTQHAFRKALGGDHGSTGEEGRG